MNGHESGDRKAGGTSSSQRGPVRTRAVAQQEDAVKSSQRYLNLAVSRYKLGIDSYLNVITAQTTYLLNRQTLANLQEQQMTASVQLVAALGGGWNAAEMSSPKQLLSKAPLILNTEH